MRARAREWDCIGDVQGGCLPDKASTRYCSSDGYSTVPSETVPNTKNNHRRGTNQYTSNATVWCMNMTWQYDVVCPNAYGNIVKWSRFEPKVQIQLHMWGFILYLNKMSKFSYLGSTIMHENGTDGFIGFFWSIFIYKLFSSDLQINLYEFSKF